MKCFRSNNETFEYSLLTFYFLSTYTFTRIHPVIIPWKKEERNDLKFDFLFQRRSNSHKYRIHQSPRTFPKFTSLSACHPFENSLDYPLARQWKLVTRRGAFHSVVERWIAFVVDERKKDKREREKRHSNLSCAGVENSSVKLLTRDRLYACIIRVHTRTTPFARKSTPFCTFIAPRWPAFK